MILRKGLRLRRSLDRSVSSNAWTVATSLRDDRTVDRIVRNQSEVVQMILSNTEITRNHMTPEIKLFLLTPNCKLYRTPFRDVLEEDPMKKVFQEPFWSIYWPGGQALTRFILDEKEMFQPSKKGISVLDVGAGCGASAIAAKLAGARRVVANDIDEVACTAISMNAVLNNADVEVSRDDLLQGPAKGLADIIFIGDMLYDEEIAGSLIVWLENALVSGARIFLGDPGRHGLTNDLKNRLVPLKRYWLPENVRRENHGFDESTVWEFCGSRRNNS